MAGYDPGKTMRNLTWYLESASKNVSPTMVTPKSSHQLGYQIHILKVLFGNVRYIFLHQICEARNKVKFPLWPTQEFIWTFSCISCGTLGSMRPLSPEHIEGCISNTLSGSVCRYSCSSDLYRKKVFLPVLKRNTLGFITFQGGTTITKCILICFQQHLESVYFHT